MAYRRLFRLLKLSTRVLVLLCVMVLLAEGATRLLAPKSDPVRLLPLPPIVEPGLVVYSPGAGYRLAPNLQNIAAQGSTLRTNEHGIRMDAPLGKKPKTRVRVACYGDSLTFGAGVAAGDAYPAIIQEKLREFFPSHDIDVINMGVPGHTSLRGEAFISETFDEVRPDIVVVQYFMEDITVSGILDSEVAPVGIVESFLRRWAAHSQLAAHGIAAVQRRSAPGIYQARLPRVGTEDFLDAIKRIHGFCYGAGVEFLGVGPCYREAGMPTADLERLVDYKRHFSDLSGWQEIPVHFPDEINNNVALFHDHRHLTASGHRELGGRLATDLRRRVRTRINEIAENHPTIQQHTENE